MIRKEDILQIKRLIKPLLGKSAWGVSLGHGSFLTLEFGKPLSSSNQTSHVHGEWHLWIYSSAWRIEKGEKIIAACEDSRERLEKKVQLLQGLILKDIEFSRYTWDTIFIFENSICIRLFTVSLSEDSEHWMLFIPEGKTLCIGPGLTWSCENEEKT